MPAAKRPWRQQGWDAALCSVLKPGYGRHDGLQPLWADRAKDTQVREIDALGGEMARVADRNLLQVRMLNTGKGPAVQALRAQIDKLGYQRTMRLVLEQQPNLYLREDMAEEIRVENGVLQGILGRSGAFYPARAVIICSGVYLSSEIFLGNRHYPAAPRLTSRLWRNLAAWGLF